MKGLLWFAFLLTLYILFKDRVEIDPESWVGRVSDRPLLVYAIFMASEIVIGIIPPEIFMGWAATTGSVVTYAGLVLLLAIISYAAGVLGYFIGRYLSQTVFFRFTRRRFFSQMEKFFKTYGGFLIFVAAVTPLPYSAVCMLVGSVEYPFMRFLLITLSRFLRFAVYAYILWEAGDVTIGNPA